MMRMHQWNLRRKKDIFNMTYQTKIISSNKNTEPEHELDGFIKAQNKKSLLRFITCGSVDDGKSTLIGRLLYDSKLLMEDQLLSLQKDSRKKAEGDDEIDFSLLVDGLSEEREQGITIDVAYRFFETDKRKFIVADTPGHEEYTRNMTTGASTADLAIILIDARKGVLKQTKRHSFIAKLMGIKNIVVAINKMDLVYYSEEVFFQIQQDYHHFAWQLELENVTFIPLSAKNGENVSSRSGKLNWYNGVSLLEFLEDVQISQQKKNGFFRFPVQWVNRPNLNFRGFSGNITSGSIKSGDEIYVLPGSKITKVKNIFVADRQVKYAREGQAITLTTDDEIDISRGDIIVKRSDQPEINDKIRANVIWMHESALSKDRSYLIKTCNKTLTAQVIDVVHKIDMKDLRKTSSETLSINEIGVVNLALHEKIAFDSYMVKRTTGSFIMIDRLTNETVGCGMIETGLNQSLNIHWQDFSIRSGSRAEQKGQEPAVLWFTGLSGAGKSTIANLVEKELYALGKHSYLLDGDNIRHGLSGDLGFSDKDRIENIRRISEVAKLMNDAGLIVLTSFISPFENERIMAQKKLGDNYIEIFIDTPLEICEERDKKGLYQKARTGELNNFTGIGSAYERPANPDIHIKGGELSAQEATKMIISYLAENQII